jgi:5'-nucleotidase / UDP-sugar diphosphatase
MRQARFVRRLFRSPLLVACAMLSIGVASGCGATAAPPTPTSVPPTAAAAPPVASPQRPPLASPAASPSLPASTPVAVASAEPEQTYEVQSGDTLLSISEQFYGDATRWRRIYDANRDLIGADPDKLKLEMKLKIPPKES